MTTLLDQPPVASPRAEERRGRPLWRALPWLVPAVVAAGVLLRYDTPAGQIAVYALYFAVAVVLPGTLVLRALYGSRGNWPEDLGLGAAAGLLVQLAGWALAAATGVELLLPAWIGAVLLLFVAVPRLRRHWRISEPSPLPLAWSWGMAVVLSLVALWGAITFRATPLPPVTFQLYQDVYYHLALVHEMMRAMPFQVPQVYGETLRYHYLSDADIASASMLTGISPVTVYLRLWLLPIVGVAVFVFAALARTISGRWWTGPVAAAAAFAGRAITFNGPLSPVGGGSPVSFISPSQTYAVPLIGLFALVCLEALRGRKLGRMWAVLPVLAVVCAGSKSSVLPPLFAGVGLAGLVLLLRRRAMPWTAAGLLATIAFGIVAGLKLFAGGGAGTLGLQPLATLRSVDPYVVTLGDQDGITLGGFWPHGVAEAGATGKLFIFFLLAWWVLAQAPRLLGLVVPLPGRDIAWWMVGGIVIGGTAALWLFWHPSGSQGYFYLGVIPFAAVLTVCAVPDRFHKAAIAAAAAGALWAVVAPQTTHRPAVNTFTSWGLALAVPFLITAGLVVLVAGVAFVIWRRRALVALPTALMAVVIGAGLATGINNTITNLQSPKPAVRPATAVTAAEMRAALWLDEHAGRDDLVATNVHCVPLDAVKCNSRAFWVAALGGRRTLIESWAYSDAAVAAHGVNGLAYYFQPAPDPAVFALNQRAFAQGDAADIKKLREVYGVRWLFADSRAGAISPALERVATVRYRDGAATVYELVPAA